MSMKVLDAAVTGGRRPTRLCTFHAEAQGNLCFGKCQGKIVNINVYKTASSAVGSETNCGPAAGWRVASDHRVPDCGNECAAARCFSRSNAAQVEGCEEAMLQQLFAAQTGSAVHRSRVSDNVALSARA
jgi:hypothetical protein